MAEVEKYSFLASKLHIMHTDLLYKTIYHMYMPIICFQTAKYFINSDSYVLLHDKLWVASDKVLHCILLCVRSGMISMLKLWKFNPAVIHAGDINVL